MQRCLMIKESLAYYILFSYADVYRFPSFNLQFRCHYSAISQTVLADLPFDFSVSPSASSGRSTNSFWYSNFSATSMTGFLFLINLFLLSFRVYKYFASNKFLATEFESTIRITNKYYVSFDRRLIITPTQVENI